eukprot:TRINITY_DN3772_c0_g1_i1.p1 TRINITY_DN3772_c0_g1~~TRINITY_DN3772_c0_g1_i1.p1  ORF type:complete len:583 (-),score=204.75 TRINITY_DN3772_c0_g1_i1:307-2055(-)
MPELCNPEIVAYEKTSGCVVDVMTAKKAESERSDSPKSEVSSGLYDVSSTSSEAGSLDDNVSESGGSEHSDLTEEMLSTEMSQMQLSSEELDTMASLGADVRHMTQTSYKLAATTSSRKTSAQRVVPGQALRDMAQAQRDAMEQHEKRKSVKPPPGFEKMYGSAGQEDATASEEAGSQQPEPIMVSYADGSNTLTLSAEPLCLHNITVASAVDSCHVFIKQMNNPTHAGLAPLEEAMLEAYQLECGPELLRPIATGSLLAVKSDSKWYRCQVVAFNEANDTCDIKFVDHGGYTTVPVSDLRQLRTDFIRLPFQAIEVYLAHMSPATDEIVIDIVSDILFRDDVSINMVGHAEDGVPVVQAFFYVNDFVHLLTQEVVDDCMSVLKSEFPDYTPVPTKFVQIHNDHTQQQVVVSKEDQECAAYSDWSVEADAEDEGVWSGVSSNATESEPARSGLNSPVCGEEEYHQQHQHLEPGVPVSPAPTACYTASNVGTEVMPTPGCELVPVPVFTYCLQDPETGILYYVAAPVQVAQQVPGQQLAYYGSSENSGEQVQTSDETCDHHQQFDKPFEEWTQEDYEKYYQEE